MASSIAPASLHGAPAPGRTPGAPPAGGAVAARVSETLARLSAIVEPAARPAALAELLGLLEIGDTSPVLAEALLEEARVAEQLLVGLLGGLERRVFPTAGATARALRISPAAAELLAELSPGVTLGELVAARPAGVRLDRLRRAAELAQRALVRLA